MSATGISNNIKKEFGIEEAFRALGLETENDGTAIGSETFSSGAYISSYSPVDGSLIGKVKTTTKEDYEKVVAAAQEAFKAWRKVTAPQRGEIIRQFNLELRRLKEPLGKLVSYEMGKSYQEGLGEVQEMIDITDFGHGLSRQLYGYTMKSERPGHRMYDQYHPIGILGVISSFNFPVAPWAWNTALAWVCGDVSIWKGSEKTPLCSVAAQNIIANILDKNNMPKGISCMITGDASVAQFMTKDERVPLISATGSTRMGKAVAQDVAARLGKSLLELGGNNAIIVTPNANLKNTVIGSVFGAVGTAGQRCTSTRRLIVHEEVYDKVKKAMSDAYSQLKIGNPLDTKNHVGPLIDTAAVELYQNALNEIEKEGGKIIVKGGILKGEGYESGCYVKPVIAEVENDFEIAQKETFAPILYLIKYSGDVENAIELQNGVRQGLSSAIMTDSLQEAERFLSAEGSDCGIANVNIGTSGAEIGGAFGGEKDTGGGRESGSDAWKFYMRRQTNTINYTSDLPLAQGVKFDL